MFVSGGLAVQEVRRVEHKKTARNVVDGLDAVDFPRMPSMLKNQLNAKKRMFLGHRGVVNQSKALPPQGPTPGRNRTL